MFGSWSGMKKCSVPDPVSNIFDPKHWRSHIILGNTQLIEVIPVVTMACSSRHILYSNDKNIKYRYLLKTWHTSMLPFMAYRYCLPGEGRRFIFAIFRCHSVSLHFFRLVHFFCFEAKNLFNLFSHCFALTENERCTYFKGTVAQDFRPSVFSSINPI
jgi:hypothetical protein